MTTQVPHAVSIVFEKGAEQPGIDYPPITVFRFSPSCYHAGIDTHILDGMPVKIYSHEKTLTDCFKFRNRMGMDVVISEHQADVGYAGLGIRFRGFLDSARIELFFELPLYFNK